MHFLSKLNGFGCMSLTSHSALKLDDALCQRSRGRHIVAKPRYICHKIQWFVHIRGIHISAILNWGWKFWQLESTEVLKVEGDHSVIYFPTFSALETDTEGEELQLLEHSPSRMREQESTSRLACLLVGRLWSDWVKIETELTWQFESLKASISDCTRIWPSHCLHTMFLDLTVDFFLWLFCFPLEKF